MKGARLAYLHVGIEKTGTTSIQSFLANNREALQRSGVAYPRSPGHANHIKLNAYAMNDDKIDDTRTRYDLKSASDIEPFRNAFRQQLHREIRHLGSYDKFVFSNEHCSDRLTEPEEVNRLLDLLQPMFSNIKVVIYLREQGANMVSSYSTNLRNGSTRIPGPGFDRRKYDYYQRVKRWADQVGRSSVDLRIYDRSEFVGGDLILDFLDAIEVEWRDEFYIPDRKNERIDARSLEFLRRFNEVAPTLLSDSEAQAARAKIVRALENLTQGPTLAYPSDVLQSVREASAESNERLAREFFDRDDLFPTYDSSSSGRNEIERPELTTSEILETIVRIAAEI